jgi:hypothetical protein
LAASHPLTLLSPSLFSLHVRSAVPPAPTHRRPLCHCASVSEVHQSPSSFFSSQLHSFLGQTAPATSFSHQLVTQRVFSPPSKPANSFRPKLPFSIFKFLFIFKTVSNIRKSSKIHTNSKICSQMMKSILLDNF